MKNLKVIWSVRTECGPKRDKNEDAVYPNTSGNKSLDAIRTNELCLSVIKFSRNILDKNGVVVSKLFMGEDFEITKDYAKKTFKRIDFFKPNSSRDNSRETYIHCNRLNT